MKKRINVTIDEKTLFLLDEMASLYSLSRSATIGLAIVKYCQQEKMLEVLPDFVALAKKEQAKQSAE